MIKPKRKKIPEVKTNTPIKSGRDYLKNKIYAIIRDYYKYPSIEDEPKLLCISLLELRLIEYSHGKVPQLAEIVNYVANINEDSISMIFNYKRMQITTSVSLSGFIKYVENYYAEAEKKDQYDF